MLFVSLGLFYHLWDYCQLWSIIIHYVNQLCLITNNLTIIRFWIDLNNFQDFLSIIVGFIIFQRTHNKYFYNFDKLRLFVNKNMYTGFKPNTSVSKTVVSGLGQTQLQTLQREVDTYTRKLQQEKKKYFSIQDTHKIVTEQYEKQKSKLDELKKQNSKAQNVIVQAKIKNLQASLQKAVSTYDQTMAHNLKLKAEIDMLRRQKLNYIESENILVQQISKHEDEIKKKLTEIDEKKSTAESLKTKIIQTKQKNEVEREQYIKQFDNLQKQYLKEKRDREMNKFEKNAKPEPIDTQPLLKYRLKKLIKSNKNKIKMIEQYKKHMKNIEQAFNQIKKNSGIEDLNEITNTFIKSEQQNYSLYNYMDSLTRNIDSLEKANAELEENIQKQQELDTERKKIMQLMPQEQKRKKELQQYISKKQQATKELNSLIQAIRPNLSSALLQLSNSVLNDDPSKPAEYSLGITINERTIESYLSDLQKFINNLLIIKQEVKPKIVNSMKDNVTSYTKSLPNVSPDDVAKDKPNGNEPKDEQKFMEQQRFREYAMEYWDKKKNKNGSNTKE